MPSSSPSPTTASADQLPFANLPTFTAPQAGADEVVGLTAGGTKPVVELDPQRRDGAESRSGTRQAPEATFQSFPGLPNSTASKSLRPARLPTLACKPPTFLQPIQASPSSGRCSKLQGSKKFRN